MILHQIPVRKCPTGHRSNWNQKDDAVIVLDQLSGRTLKALMVMVNMILQE